MIDARELVERVGRQYPFPDDAYERFLRRRDRRGRLRRSLAWLALSVILIAGILAYAAAIRG